MKEYLLLIITFLLFSCTNQKETSVKRFILISIEDEIIVSAKSDFKDTLFYEHRFSDSIKYFYVLLTKEQNEELKSLIENVYAEKDSPKFELSSGQELFIVDNGKVQFYKNDFSKESENYKKINFFLKETSSKMIETNEIKNFWNIEKIIPPPNPPKKIERVVFKNNSY